MGKLVRGVVTLFGTAVGSALGFAIGGPLGAKIGAVLGAGLGSVGGSALAPRPRAPRNSPENVDRLRANIDPRTPRKIVVGETAMATDIR